jgi:hypothetical protein
MKMIHIEATGNTPEIYFSPEENNFFIHGTSSPEDVRSLYYPVTDWIRIFVDDVIEGEYPQFDAFKPVKFITDLTYFNSSSAKFLFDIFTELKRLPEAGFPVDVQWFFDSDDPDQREAGGDIASLIGIEFEFIEKK